MRDSQRQKVYDAESKFRYQADIPRVDSIESAQAIVDEVTNTLNLTPLTAVHNGRLRRYAGQYVGWKKIVEFSGPKPNLSVVLHEAAHHINRHRGRSSATGVYGIRPHGGGFTEAMLATVRLIMGEDHRKVLNEAYIDKNVLVGMDSEVEHIEKNRQKGLEYWSKPSRDEEEGKVLVVQKTNGMGTTMYHAGRDSYGDYYTTTKHYAKGFRYPKAAQKAGERLWHDGFEVVEYDGYYDAHKKHWVPN